MTTTNFDIAGWLTRLNISHQPPVSADGLKLLHQAQAYQIAFENFDILFDAPIDLKPHSLEDKLIDSRRGGYCFELNSLFMMGLIALGFYCRPLLGRVQLGPEPTARGHALTLVTVNEEPWIADVGFGANGLRCPIPLTADIEHKQDGQVFRLIKHAEFDWMLQVKQQSNWQNVYSFDLANVYPADLAMGNHFSSTSPHSIFTRIAALTIPTPKGRNTLRGDHIIFDSDGETTKVFWKTTQELRDIFNRDFHLNLSKQEVTALIPWLKDQSLNQ